ncbi:MAG: PilN domain-containing protein [Candidatus Saccharimonadales bacterium]
MINLLPHDIKQDIMYARRNTKLRTWIIAAIVSLTGVGFIVIGGLIYMKQSVNSYTSQVNQSREGLKSQQLEETQKRVEEISTNTKLTVQVLSREILFSKLIRQIGSALPAGTALQSLKIDTVKGGIQLNAQAVDFDAGARLQLNLQDPKNGVFEKADINSINCASTTTNSSSTTSEQTRRYPCDVNLRALFGKNNSYVYITPPTTETKQPGARP